ncbi:sigma factor-like helix-turn-helix DNA-binding protein [Mycobacterium sp. UM_Kg1]|uniref:sigma factor-like helix-turn-helix DNA-binding protein n=1 Tax=Mycobacterium sp. UM_Kg1 TaxID=1545691 RepID=UPI000697156C|nr:sigma factor-like helix-turn-helix DNA-binding protein [Mycobacterium sp. UM_Kg1]
MTTDDRARLRSASAATPAGVAARRSRVAAALAHLSAEHRALLRRAVYDGWSTDQIAVDLEIAESSVKAQLHYALRSLQRTLRDMGTVL